MPVTAYVSRKTAKGPDPALVRDQLYWLQSTLKVYGAKFFCEHFFWILRKKAEAGEAVYLPTAAWNRRLIPWVFNPIQEDIENRIGKRNIFLKPRQCGYTTFMVNRRLYLPAITEPGTGGLLISHKKPIAGLHFMILKRAHRLFGAVDPYDWAKNELTRQLHENLLHTEYSSRHELIFDQLDSRIICESAEVEEAGQGLTLQHVVCSELARWPRDPEETLSNLKESIPDDGTLDLESTANGMGGYFYRECMRARDPQNREAEFAYFFHPWWHDPSLRLKPAIDVKTLTEEEQELRRQFALDLEQITWRRKKYISQRKNFLEKFPEDDIRCFLLTGNPFFDVEIVATRLRELQNYKPLAVHRNGDLRIFNKRIRGRTYVIGIDPASGRDVGDRDTDYCTMVVLDIETGEEMAAFRARVPPEDLAADAAELGRLYNNAMIAVERTGDGGTVILTLQVQHGYANLYQHREWTKKDQVRAVIEILGFPTTTKTRPVALNKLAAFAREQPELIWDVQFLEEALQFARDRKGKPAAEQGAHDDTISARWVAHYVRLVLLGYLDPVAAKRERYGEDTDAEGEGEEAG